MLSFYLMFHILLKKFYECNVYFSLFEKNYFNDLIAFYKLKKIIIYKI